jgi:protoheme IX farnesyltransferase
MINYYLITKPGIILGNLFTLAAGFLLASKGNINFYLFLETLLGLSFVVASACVFNNYIDRKLDEKMERTKNRPLVTGQITGPQALAFGTVLGLVGLFIFFEFTNLLTTAIVSFGFFVYVFLYSFWKARTIYGTAIGSIAGAVPPVIGYCAVSNQLDMGALILFVMLIFWQMPHFFAIALYHYDDYKAAHIPVLPFIKGVYRTKVHMLIYIVCFFLSAILLTFFQYTGMVYLGITTTITLIWLAACLKGFLDIEDNQMWGKKMFQISLILITAVCITIPLDRI